MRDRPSGGGSRDPTARRISGRGSQFKVHSSKFQSVSCEGSFRGGTRNQAPPAPAPEAGPRNLGTSEPRNPEPGTSNPEPGTRNPEPGTRNLESGTRVLLTGGAGFIGSHLAEALLRSGAELTIVDNLNTFYDPQVKRRNLEEISRVGRYTFHHVDILDLEAIAAVFANARPEIVIHLAAYAGVRPSLERPALYDRVNVTGTLRLLELCRRHPVRRFVFGSTSSVYGVNSKIPFSEEDPLNQLISPYAVTKRAAELMGYSYHYNFGTPVTCLRFFTVYGPRQRPEMAIHRFTRRILRGEPLQVFHEGRSSRDYTYIDDIVQGVQAAIVFDGGFEIFNLGNSESVELLDLIRTIERALGTQAQIELAPAQPGDVPTTLADISKARRLLGYSPKVGLEEGVSRFVEWFRSQGC